MQAVVTSTLNVVLPDMISIVSFNIHLLLQVNVMLSNAPGMQ